jgi:hypothetical protein
MGKWLVIPFHEDFFLDEGVYSLTRSLLIGDKELFGG